MKKLSKKQKIFLGLFAVFCIFFVLFVNRDNPNAPTKEYILTHSERYMHVEELYNNLTFVLLDRETKNYYYVNRLGSYVSEVKPNENDYKKEYIKKYSKKNYQPNIFYKDYIMTHPKRFMKIGKLSNKVNSVYLDIKTKNLYYVHSTFSRVKVVKPNEPLYREKVVQRYLS